MPMSYSGLCDIFPKYSCVYVSVCVCCFLYLRLQFTNVLAQTDKEFITFSWQQQMGVRIIFYPDTTYKHSYRRGYLSASVPEMDWHNTDCILDLHVDEIMKERLIEQLSHLLQILVLLSY